MKLRKELGVMIFLGIGVLASGSIAQSAPVDAKKNSADKESKSDSATASAGPKTQGGSGLEETAKGQISTPEEEKAPESEAGSATEQSQDASKAPQGIEESYLLRLKALESKVNELKEKIFKSKARLTLLAETVISGALTGAKAKLYHVNEMGSSFKLQSVTYVLDGQTIYTRQDKDGDLADAEEIEIYNSPLLPGNHTLNVTMIYSGNGYGIFTYLDGYRFKVKSSYVFQAQDGKIIDVKVIGYEKGGLTVDLKDRPSVRFDVKIQTDTESINKMKQQLKEESEEEL